jgi:hypothetical protein
LVKKGYLSLLCPVVSILLVAAAMYFMNNVPIPMWLRFFFRQTQLMYLGLNAAGIFLGISNLVKYGLKFIPILGIILSGLLLWAWVFASQITF